VPQLANAPLERSSRFEFVRDAVAFSLFAGQAMKKLFVGRKLNFRLTESALSNTFSAKERAK
jgi:hypothetical protein